MNDYMLRSALGYVTTFGWPVFPLAPRTKKPLAGSHGCLDATNDPDQIRKWFEKTPNANIGLATGIVNFVLDVDPRHGGDQSLEQLEAKHGRLPDTIQQISGRGVGRHYVFTVPEGVEIRCGQIASGLDIKGRGGYILLAPSIHPDSGKPYAWDGADELKNQKVLSAPEWLMQLVLRLGVQSSEAQVPVEESIESMAMVLATGWPPHGKRHESFLALAGACAHAGLDRSEAHALTEALYRQLWPKDAWLDEAKREVNDTYDTFTGGGKITGIPKLKQLGADRTVLRQLSIWMKKRALAEEDRKADATASMSDEDRLARLNRYEIFAKAQPVAEWAEFRRIGRVLEGVLTTGEYVRFMSTRELMRPQEAMERIADDLEIVLVPRAVTRDKRHEWLKIVRDMQILAKRGERSRRGGLEKEVQDTLQQAFDASGRQRPTTTDERHKLHESMNSYRRNAMPTTEAPPCVYVWEGLVWTHPSTLRRWSSLPSGDNRKWTLTELEDALVLSEFRYNEPIQITRDGERSKIRLMSGPLSAIDEDV